VRKTGFGRLDFYTASDIGQGAASRGNPLLDGFVVSRLKNRKRLLESRRVDVCNIMAQHLKPMILYVRSRS
jgi:hypothetical protein